MVSFSDFFNVFTGDMQDYTLAPYPFFLVLDYPMRQATHYHGFVSHPRRSSRAPAITHADLAFADDIALFDQSLPAAQQHVTNTALLRMVHAEPLILEVYRRQLKKTGHRLRQPPTSIANRSALYAPTHGYRGRGRPRSSFQAHIARLIDPIIPPSEAEIRTNPRPMGQNG
jgi:hypothetical protein